MIIDELKNLIRHTLQDLGMSYEGDIHIEHPSELSHGDFATNIAMVLAQKEGKKPRDLAEIIVQELMKKKSVKIKECNIAGPGFINIMLSDEFFTMVLKQILEQKDQYGESHRFKGKKILVEHSSPNLFKAFHIGHLMNNTVGESIVRLYKKSAAEVTTISYPSDVSLGIGKAVWQLLVYGISTLEELPSLEEKIAFLGRCYSEGTRAYDEQDIEARVREITQDIYEQRDTEAYRAYLIGKELNLRYFKHITKRLGSTFDHYLYESEAGKVGKELVLEHTPEIFSHSGESIIYEGEQDGLHTRVFINKEGNPTYEAKDTGLLKLKFNRFEPDLSVFVTDDQQRPYFEVVIKAASKISPMWKEQTIHATHGRMKFKGQKMSSRLGNTPLVGDILHEVNQEVHQRASEKELTQDQADQISLSALKYSILRTQLGKNVNFDPEVSLSFEGDSGPYIQYTYARVQSLLRKAEQEGLSKTTEVPKDWKTETLEHLLYRFPEVVDQAAKELQPHLVVTYVTTLAQAFNRWYNSSKIVDSSDSQSPYKIALAEASGVVCKNSLWLLGIESPEEM